MRHGGTQERGRVRPGRKAHGSVCSTRAKTERCRERKAFSKWRQKLLRRRRGNILGLIVERWGPAGCAPVFEVLWRSSPSHKAPLALSRHPSPRLTSKGEDATWARPTVRGVNRMWSRAESPVRWHLPQSSVRHKSTACLCYTDGGRRPRREHIHVYHVSYLTFPVLQGQGAEHYHMCGITEGSREMSWAACWIFYLFSCRHSDKILPHISVWGTSYCN